MRRQCFKLYGAPPEEVVPRLLLETQSTYQVARLLDVNVFSVRYFALNNGFVFNKITALWEDKRVPEHA